MAASHEHKGGNAWKREQLWSNAIRVAVSRATTRGEPTKRLQSLAEKCVELGLSGDMTAIKEIGDRLDGRAAGNENLTLDVGPSLVSILLRRRDGPRPLDLEPGEFRSGSSEGDPGPVAISSPEHDSVEGSGSDPLGPRGRENDPPGVGGSVVDIDPNPLQDSGDCLGGEPASGCGLAGAGEMAFPDAGPHAAGSDPHRRKTGSDGL